MSRAEYLLLYRTDFLAFAPVLLQELGVSKDIARAWHAEVLADAATQCTPGAGRWAMVNAPPRHLKSLICSVAWPLFVAANYPGVRIVVVAGTRELASDLASKRRQVIAGARFRGVFEGLAWREEGDAVRFSNGSEIVGVAAGRSQVGRGADLMIIDDPQTPTQAIQPTQQEQGLAWFKTEVAPRLNGAGASVLLVTQRLHKDDLCGQLSGSQYVWNTLVLPAIAEADRNFRFQRGQTVRQRQGEPLCAAIADREALLKKLEEVDGRTFAAQYLQQPVHASDGSEWFIYFEGSDVHDGWQAGDPTLETGFYRVSHRRKIMRQCFGMSLDQSPPSRRAMTAEEWEAATMIQQKNLIEQCRIAD